MREPVSIFNDVIGPVMIGPSSSHTAASVRIGWMIRRMLNDQPERIDFFFSDQGSLASCHEPQGTDMGLAGGLLGMQLEDPEMIHSMETAVERGISITFTITHDPVDHPNCYVFRACGGGRSISGEAVSTGGGMIEFRDINGFPVSMTGGAYELLVTAADEEEAAAVRFMKTLENRGNGTGRILKGGHSGGIMLTFTSEAPVAAAEIEAALHAEDIISLEPILPVASFRKYDGLFNTAEEILQLAGGRKMRLSDAAIEYEVRRSGKDREAVFHMMEEIVAVMRRTLKKVSEDQKDYPDRILGPQADKMKAYGSPLLPPFFKKIIENTTYFMEAKSSMEVIVAAPTCGSCAVLPGSILTAAEHLGAGTEETVRAMFAAAMIGVILAEHATIAGEVGGCQAECGSASGMAAAGLAELMGADAEKALAAAGMALQNTFGMVCDPVAGRVEVPCLGKNIQAGLNALSSAGMAMAGYDPVIPFDETVAAFFEVGESIAPELRCTCLGGLSVTPTSSAIKKQLKECRQA